MKKLMITLGLCCLTSIPSLSNANSNSIDELEEMLLEHNLIDENYRYTDVETVEALFAEVTSELKEEQLNNPNEDPQLTDMTYTPYLMAMEFHTKDAYSDAERKMFEYYMTSDEMIQDGCNDLYTSNFFRANNYVIEMTFYDALDKSLGKIKLDKYVCR